MTTALATTVSNGETGQHAAQPPEGILNSCRTKILMGVVEAVNGNVKALLRRGRWLPRSQLFATEGAALGNH
jgi:hypothetical protein